MSRKAERVATWFHENALESSGAPLGLRDEDLLDVVEALMKGAGFAWAAQDDGSVVAVRVLKSTKTSPSRAFGHAVLLLRGLRVEHFPAVMDEDQRRFEGFVIHV